MLVDEGQFLLPISVDSNFVQDEHGASPSSSSSSMLSGSLC